MASLLDPQTAAQTAQLLGPSAAFLAAGYSLSLSQTLPALYEQRPQFSIVAFQQIIHQAGRVLPALTLLSTSSFAYLAYAVPEQRREWAKAAIAMFLAISWEGLVMRKGGRRAREIKRDGKAMVKAEQNLEGRQIVVRWVKQNSVAVALQFAGAVVGVRALLKSA